MAAGGGSGADNEVLHILPIGLLALGVFLLFMSYFEAEFGTSRTAAPAPAAAPPGLGAAAGPGAEESVDLSFRSLAAADASLQATPARRRGGIFAINLTGNELVAVPDPALLRSFPALQTLDCSRNRIAELPASLGQLARSLHRLVVAGNQLQALPDAIGDLYNMRELNVAQNALATLPKALARCENLEILHAQDNALTSVEPGLAPFLAALDRFEHARNPWTNPTHPRALRTPPSLRALAAARCASMGLRTPGIELVPCTVCGMGFVSPDDAPALFVGMSLGATVAHHACSQPCRGKVLAELWAQRRGFRW